MPLGVVEFREVPKDQRRAKRPFVRGTNRIITENSVGTRGWGAIAFVDLANGLDIEYEEEGADGVTNVRRYAVVPVAVRRLLESTACEHPGLALDKFVYRSGDQSFVKHSLAKIVEVNNAGQEKQTLLQSLRQRREAVLQRLGAATFTATTAAP
ncbi:MAG: hypothetical protein ACUVUC_10690, partial [Thermoguttaceae bacterium]